MTTQELIRRCEERLQGACKRVLEHAEGLHPEELVRLLSRAAESPDLSDEERKQLTQALQVLLVVPLLNAALNVAMETRMQLPEFLSLVGAGWELLRGKALTNEITSAINQDAAPQSTG